MTLPAEIYATDRALAAYERRTLNPPESYDDPRDTSKPFIEWNVPDQLDAMGDYFRKHPEEVVNVAEYITTTTNQQLLTNFLHGNSREISSFHHQLFIEHFASKVQAAIDKGEIE